MRTVVVMVMLVFLPFVTPAYAKTAHYEAVVAEPFLELHTGPGRGFPVFHVVDRGQRIEVLKRRTDWFQVRTDRGVRGWVKLEDMGATLDVSGSATQIRTRMSMITRLVAGRRVSGSATWMVPA
jgi:uncharacterized protein YgiM (DUF1202 family)